MNLDFIPRNNDLGACVPTFQERVNTMLPCEQHVALDNAQAAQALDGLKHPITPHMPSSVEVEQTLSMMETEAQNQNIELLRIHSGLNRERVIRLLELLR